MARSLYEAHEANKSPSQSQSPPRELRRERLALELQVAKESQAALQMRVDELTEEKLYSFKAELTSPDEEIITRIFDRLERQMGYGDVKLRTVISAHGGDMAGFLAPLMGPGGLERRITRSLWRHFWQELKSREGPRAANSFLAYFMRNAETMQEKELVPERMSEPEARLTEPEIELTRGIYSSQPGASLDAVPVQCFEGLFGGDTHGVLRGLSMVVGELLIPLARLLDWLTELKQSNGSEWLQYFLQHIARNAAQNSQQAPRFVATPSTLHMSPGSSYILSPDHKWVSLLDNVAKAQNATDPKDVYKPGSIYRIELELADISEAASLLHASPNAIEALAAPASTVFTRVAWQGVRVCRSAAEAGEAGQGALRHLLAQAKVLEAALAALDETPDFSPPDLEQRHREISELPRAYSEKEKRDHFLEKRIDSLSIQLEKSSDFSTQVEGENNSLRVCIAELESKQVGYEESLLKKVQDMSDLKSHITVLTKSLEEKSPEIAEELSAMRDQVLAEQVLTDHANGEAIKAKDDLRGVLIELRACQELLDETEVGRLKAEHQLGEALRAAKQMADARDWSIDAAGVVQDAFKDKETETAVLRQALAQENLSEEETLVAMLDLQNARAEVEELVAKLFEAERRQKALEEELQWTKGPEGCQTKEESPAGPFRKMLATSREETLESRVRSGRSPSKSEGTWHHLLERMGPMKLLRAQEKEVHVLKAKLESTQAQLDTIKARSQNLIGAAEQELEKREAQVKQLKTEVEAQGVARSAMVEESRKLVLKLQVDLSTMASKLKSQTELMKSAAVEQCDEQTDQGKKELAAKLKESDDALQSLLSATLEAGMSEMEDLNLIPTLRASLAEQDATLASMTAELDDARAEKASLSLSLRQREESLHHLSYELEESSRKLESSEARLQRTEEGDFGDAVKSMEMALLSAVEEAEAEKERAKAEARVTQVELEALQASWLRIAPEVRNGSLSAAQENSLAPEEVLSLEHNELQIAQMQQELRKLQETVLTMNKVERKAAKEEMRRLDAALQSRVQGYKSALSSAMASPDQKISLSPQATPTKGSSSPERFTDLLSSSPERFAHLLAAAEETSVSPGRGGLGLQHLPDAAGALLSDGARLTMLKKWFEAVSVGVEASPIRKTAPEPHTLHHTKSTSHIEIPRQAIRDAYSPEEPVELDPEVTMPQIRDAWPAMGRGIGLVKDKARDRHVDAFLEQLQLAGWHKLKFDEFVDLVERCQDIHSESTVFGDTYTVPNTPEPTPWLPIPHEYVEEKSDNTFSPLRGSVLASSEKPSISLPRSPRDPSRDPLGIWREEMEALERQALDTNSPATVKSMSPSREAAWDQARLVLLEADLKSKKAHVMELQAFIKAQGADLATVSQKLAVCEKQSKEEEPKKLLPNPFDETAMLTARDEAEELFDACDKNTDGSLSHTEMKRYLEEAPWSLAYLANESFQWDHLWSAYDTNKNGNIDKLEFIRLYQERLYPLIQAKNTLEANETPETAATMAGAMVLAQGGGAEVVGATAHQAALHAFQAEKGKKAFELQALQEALHACEVELHRAAEGETELREKVTEARAETLEARLAAHEAEAKRAEEVAVVEEKLLLEHKSKMEQVIGKTKEEIFFAEARLSELQTRSDAALLKADLARRHQVSLQAWKEAGMAAKASREHEEVMALKMLNGEQKEAADKELKILKESAENAHISALDHEKALEEALEASNDAVLSARLDARVAEAKRAKEVAEAEARVVAEHEFLLATIAKDSEEKEEAALKLAEVQAQADAAKASMMRQEHALKQALEQSKEETLNARLEFQMEESKRVKAVAEAEAKALQEHELRMEDMERNTLEHRQAESERVRLSNASKEATEKAGRTLRHVGALQAWQKAFHLQNLHSKAHNEHEGAMLRLLSLGGQKTSQKDMVVSAKRVAALKSQAQAASKEAALHQEALGASPRAAEEEAANLRAKVDALQDEMLEKIKEERNDRAAFMQRAAYIAGRVAGEAKVRTGGDQAAVVKAAKVSAEAAKGSASVVAQAIAGARTIHLYSVAYEAYRESHQLALVDENIPEPITQEVTLAGEETAEDTSELKRLFDYMDKNGDGRVNRREAIIALRKDPRVQKYLGISGKIRQDSAEYSAFEELFEMLDGDGSSEITWDEFIWFTKMKKKPSTLNPTKRESRPLSLEAWSAMPESQSQISQLSDALEASHLQEARLLEELDQVTNTLLEAQLKEVDQAELVGELRSRLDESSGEGGGFVLASSTGMIFNASSQATVSKIANLEVALERANSLNKILAGEQDAMVGHLVNDLTELAEEAAMREEEIEAVHARLVDAERTAEEAKFNMKQTKGETEVLEIAVDALESTLQNLISAKEEGGDAQLAIELQKALAIASRKLKDESMALESTKELLVRADFRAKSVQEQLEKATAHNQELETQVRLLNRELEVKGDEGSGLAREISRLQIQINQTLRKSPAMKGPVSADDDEEEDNLKAADELKASIEDEEELRAAAEEMAAEISATKVKALQDQLEGLLLEKSLEEERWLAEAKKWEQARTMLESGGLDGGKEAGQPAQEKAEEQKPAQNATEPAGGKKKKKKKKGKGSDSDGTTETAAPEPHGLHHTKSTSHIEIPKDLTDGGKEAVETSGKKSGKTSAKNEDNTCSLIESMKTWHAESLAHAKSAATQSTSEVAPSEGTAVPGGSGSEGVLNKRLEKALRDVQSLKEKNHLLDSEMAGANLEAATARREHHIAESWGKELSRKVTALQDQLQAGDELSLKLTGNIQEVAQLDTTILPATATSNDVRETVTASGDWINSVFRVELELENCTAAATRLTSSTSLEERLAAPASAVFTRVAWQGVRVCRAAAEAGDAGTSALKHLLAQAQVLEAALAALEETPDFDTDFGANTNALPVFEVRQTVRQSPGGTERSPQKQDQSESAWEALEALHQQLLEVKDDATRLHVISGDSEPNLVHSGILRKLQDADGVVRWLQSDASTTGDGARVARLEGQVQELKEALRRNEDKHSAFRLEKEKFQAEMRGVLGGASPLSPEQQQSDEGKILQLLQTMSGGVTNLTLRIEEKTVSSEQVLEGLRHLAPPLQASVQAVKHLIADKSDGGGVSRGRVDASLEVVEARKIADELELEVEALHAALKEARNQAIEATSRAESSELSLSKAEEDLADLAQTMAMRAGMTIPDSEVQALQEEKLRLERHMLQQENSIEKAADALERMEFESSAKDEDITGLRARLTEAQTQLEVTSSTDQELVVKMKGMSSALAGARTELADRDEQIKSLRKRLDEVASGVGEADYAALETLLRETQELAKLRQIDIVKKTNSIQALQDELSELEIERDEEVEELRSRIHMLTERLDEARKQEVDPELRVTPEKAEDSGSDSGTPGIGTPIHVVLKTNPEEGVGPPLALASFVDVVDPAAVMDIGRQKFAELDGSSNSLLEDDELDMMIAVMCAQYARPGVSSQLVVQDALKAMEACGRGANSMNFEEFQSFFERLAKRHHAYRLAIGVQNRKAGSKKQQIAAKFASLTDNDLSRSTMLEGHTLIEFGEWLYSTFEISGRKLSSSELAGEVERLKEAARDCNGALSLEQLLSYLLAIKR